MVQLMSVILLCVCWSLHVNQKTTEVLGQIQSIVEQASGVIGKRHVFHDNMDFINRHNELHERNERPFRVTRNKFAHMSVSEMCSRYTGLIVDEDTDPIDDEDMSILGSSETGTSSSSVTTYTAAGGTSDGAVSVDPSTSLPDRFDWREKGYETPVLNQGGCGACWAFTAVECLEAQWLKVKNRSVGLSEQYLIDCSNQKCSGGTFKNVFEFIKQNWTVSRKAYPYTALDTGSCHEISRKIATLKSYRRIPANNEAAMMKAIANHGPIVCGVCASSQGFMLYHSGIFSLRHDGENCTTLNHAISLWGYVNDNNSSYFILKNSWGPAWGENGYMRLQMGENNCGVGDLCYYITVE